jgi:predicted nucleic acid-binding protein
MEKVFDASVVIKWFFNEEGSDSAITYLQDYGKKRFPIIVPTLLYYELGNILLAKKATKDQVDKIMASLLGLNLTNVDIGHDAFKKVFENAQDLKVTYYDASYVTLMQKYDCELITADKKLYEKIKNKFSQVRLLR